MRLPRLRTVLLVPLAIFAILYVVGAVMLASRDDALAIAEGVIADVGTIAIFGASGTAGDGVLKAALEDPTIDKIRVFTRRATPRIEAGVASGKVEMTIHMDYLDYSALHEQIADVDAVYWAIGISSLGVDEETYGRIHVDFPVRFVTEWAGVSNKADSSFHYISSSDISEDSSAMWAREKVRAENALFEFAADSKLRVVAYRPDYIGPTAEEAHLGQDILYHFFAPIGAAVKAQQIGQAMLEITARDEFENGDKFGTRNLIRYSDAYERRLTLDPVVEELVIRGGWLFDSVSDERRPNTGIIVRDGKIAAVDIDPTHEVSAQAEIIELDESETVLPGMFDLHAHYNLDLVDKGRVEEVVYNGTIFLANGVTATWSAGEYYPERVIEQRDRIDAGDAIGPRLFASGPYFGAFRCEYNIGLASDECIGWPNDITEEEIRREVDIWADQGVVSIKIKQADPEEMKILIDQAHKRGMTTAAHLANYDWVYDVELRDAIVMGVDRIEHQLTLGSGGPDSAEMPEMIDLMLEHQVFYDANLQMYGGINERKKHATEMLWTNEAQYFTPYAQSLLEERGEPAPESDEAEFTQRVLEVKSLYDAGGAHLLIIGTDEPVYTNLLPGFAYHRELLAMTYAGIPEVDVLKAATINGARALGVDDQLGTIEVGKRADFVVVRGNPLDDIKAARDVRTVIKDGVVYDAEALLKSAEGKIGPSGPDDHADWELVLRSLRDE